MKIKTLVILLIVLGGACGSRSPDHPFTEQLLFLRRDGGISDRTASGQ